MPVPNLTSTGALGMQLGYLAYVQICPSIFIHIQHSLNIFDNIYLY